MVDLGLVWILNFQKQKKRDIIKWLDNITQDDISSSLSWETSWCPLHGLDTASFNLKLAALHGSDGQYKVAVFKVLGKRIVTDEESPY